MILLHFFRNTWRLGIPIAYNFLQILNIRSCAFLQVMGPVQEIPFVGTDINKWVFPICLVVTVLLTLFDVYGCVLRCLGSKRVYIQGGPETIDKIEEGQFIIDQFRKDKHLTNMAATRYMSIGNHGDLLLDTELSSDQTPIVKERDTDKTCDFYQIN